MTEKGLSSTELIGAFLHSLGHTLRTPLSVISNELYYLASLTPKGECDRAIRRCTELSETLKRVSVLSRADSPHEEVDLAQVLAELDQTHSLETFTIKTDPVRIRELCILIPEFMRQAVHELSVDNASLQTGRKKKSILPVIHAEESAITWTTSLMTENSSSKLLSTYATFFQAHALFDLPEAALLDFLTQSLGFRIGVTRDGHSLAVRMTTNPITSLGGA
jgi:hypothetical protein